VGTGVDLTRLVKKVTRGSAHGIHDKKQFRRGGIVPGKRWRLPNPRLGGVRLSPQQAAEKIRKADSSRAEAGSERHNKGLITAHPSASSGQALKVRPFKMRGQTSFQRPVKTVQLAGLSAGVSEAPGQRLANPRQVFFRLCGRGGLRQCRRQRHALSQSRFLGNSAPYQRLQDKQGDDGRDTAQRR
jgi:hypothetical protein